MTEYFLRTLFVHTPGTRLILEGGAVKALRDDAAPRRLPLHAIDAIIVSGGIDVSTPLLLKCASQDRPVYFIGRGGTPRAVLEGPTSGRGRLRRLQFATQFDPERRDRMASVIVKGKLAQMSWALRQWARDADGARVNRLRACADAISVQVPLLDQMSRDQALGIEGTATRTYFQGLGLALRDHPWLGRVRRPATDPVNSALSFLYGMTRAAVHGAVHATGLDAYTGFLHGDLDGQPSLVLDVMEEFRPTADRVIVTAFNRRQLRSDHFEKDVSGAVRLTVPGREVAFALWHKHREQQATIVGNRAPLPNAVLPIVQANRMANALRHSVDYTPHVLAVR